MMLAILGLLLALASPLLLLPVEKFFPYPHFIEEGIKLVIVLMILRTERAKETPRKPRLRRGGVTRRGSSEVEELASGWPWVFLAGFLFAVSESILYLVNIFALGDLMIFPKRLALTGSLHTSTMMLMYFLGRKSYLWLGVGFVGAVLSHYLFNLWVASL